MSTLDPSIPSSLLLAAQSLPTSAPNLTSRSAAFPRASAFPASSSSSDHHGHSHAGNSHSDHGHSHSTQPSNSTQHAHSTASNPSSTSSVPFSSTYTPAHTASSPSHGHAHHAGDDHGHSHATPHTAASSYNPPLNYHNHPTSSSSLTNSNNYLSNSSSNYYGNSSSTNAHGHSHGAHDDHGHAHAGPSSSSSSDHGHSHGGTSSSSSFSTSTLPAAAASSNDHGHSHAGNSHGHSHSAHAHAHASPSVPIKSFFSDNYPNPFPLTVPFLSSLFLAADTSRLTLYLTLKGTLTCTLFILGLLYSSDLLSTSFHLLFDCTALLFSLYSIVQARRPRWRAYSYGSSRFEVVSAFTNSIFLFFVSTFLTIELFHTLVSGVEVKDLEEQRLTFTATLFTLGSSLVGMLLLFKYSTLKGTNWLASLAGISPPTAIPASSTTSSLLGASNGSSSSSSSSSSASSSSSSLPHQWAHHCNMHSIWLFVCSDFFQSLFSLISTLPTPLLSPTYLTALAFCSAAVILLYLTIPLFTLTVSVLLCTAEEEKKGSLDKVIREIQFLDGVLECRSSHVWSTAPTLGAYHSNAGGGGVGGVGGGIGGIGGIGMGIGGMGLGGVGGGHVMHSPTSSGIIATLHLRLRSDADEQLLLMQVNERLRRIVGECCVQIEKDERGGWILGVTGGE